MKDYYDNFLETLSGRYPQKSELVGALMDILPLEKESIYRRLRKDIPFTAEEVMRISGAWNISLDNIVSATFNKSKAFQLNMIDYLNPSEQDYKLFESYNSLLELVAQDPDGEITEVTNTLPGSLYNNCDNLLRFFTMKWLYKYGKPEESTPLSEIHVPERMRELERQYIELSRKIPKKYAIHDARFIEHLADEIGYFHSIRMVTAAELTILKGELLKLMDQMEDIALKGYFPETGNKLFFYLSQTWLETEYSMLESKDITLSMIKVLERNGVISFDKLVFDKFKNMVKATKRSSVLLSLSNRLEIIKFYDKQRRTIESIK